MLYETVFNLLKPNTQGLVGDREALSTAVVLRIDNVANYFHEHFEKPDVTDFPNIAPIYPETWFEYHLTSHYNEGVGILLRAFELTPGANLGKDVDMRDSKWLLMGNIFVEARPGFVTRPCDFHIGVKADGSIATRDEGKPCLSAYMNEAVGKNLKKFDALSDDQLTKVWGRFFFSALLAISFLHCKNVEVVAHGVHHPGHRSRHTHGILYHTLEIEPMKRILRTEGQNEKTGLKMALHICRGHFKDYSKGGGLFGKYNGLYWWDSQVRGSAEHGEVRKDYDVKLPREGNDAESPNP